MAGSKRERELHRAKIARQQKEAAEAAERRKRLLQIGGAVVGVIAVVALVAGIAIAGGSDDGSPSAAASGAPAITTPAPQPSDSALSKKVKCTAPSAAKPTTDQFTAADREAVILNPDATYTETMTTNCGEIEFTVDQKNAPETAQSILFLTDREQFYDGISCHRLTTEGIYVLQCGDPKGDGSGGPGYSVPDENLPEAGTGGTAVYKRGTVAMANAGPGTTGSQFFLVYKDSPLPPNYTVLGTITGGLHVLDHVAGKGVEGGGTDGPPKQPVKISKMVGSVTTAVQAPQ